MTRIKKTGGNFIDKLALGTMVSVLSFGLVVPVFAQDARPDTSTTTRRSAATEQAQERRAEQEQRAETRQENREIRRTEGRIRAEERIRNFSKSMIRRFESAIAWLEKMTERIETRIAKLKSEGVDTSVSERFVADAKDKIQIAKDKVSDLPTAIEEAMNTDDLRGSFERVRTLVKEAKDAIKEAHADLVKAINNLKPGLNREKNNAESATTTS
ncbi:MAG: hypothetical protein COV95_02020 [Candidatus Zambryskibacteria bacterium CG11_big_fil_rev_8_21_14_0_20_40_24]|uniref:Uncharacterized protein n=1 Tax=Candidatus Zambryskibacteria bacterium CG11_big_fil_rev_8_21_14_0_20_40_24 TaxID=1975116 RepID=A0A2H0K6E6_9BACT|nr:MAG: hypothetical protein COV95_02020 [Candidatus Zambryskibacteria bacterium CG11_big_fil_rev_8_21_14_0_20_40_24]